MKTSAVTGGAVVVATAALLSSPGVAAAAPTGSEPANVVVQSLRAQGYNVMLNGSISEPLSECNVTAVHNPDVSGTAAAFTTVYVDVTCPDD
jgi:hypothetical protein